MNVGLFTDGLAHLSLSEALDWLEQAVRILACGLSQLDQASSARSSSSASGGHGLGGANDLGSRVVVARLDCPSP